MDKKKKIGRTTTDYMLTEECIEAIDTCKHQIMDKNVQVWCKLSKHDCFGQKPQTKNYNPALFECLCLVYAGLCPKGIKPKWRKITLTVDDK